ALGDCDRDRPAAVRGDGRRGGGGDLRDRGGGRCHVAGQGQKEGNPLMGSGCLSQVCRSGGAHLGSACSWVERAWRRDCSPACVSGRNQRQSFWNVPSWLAMCWS